MVITFRIKKYIFTVALISLLFCSGCPVLDPEVQVQNLIIRDSRTGQEIRVLDIDPGGDYPHGEKTISIFAPGSVSPLDGTCEFSGNAVRIQKFNRDFIIKGMIAGGMGIIKFSSGERNAELRFFVRNWKAGDVYRNTLEADMVNYPYSEAKYIPSENNNNGVRPNEANRLSSYQLIRDRGFHYEAPDGLSSRSPVNGTTVHTEAPREVENWRNGKLHLDSDGEPVPHILMINDSDYLPAWDFRLQKEVFQFYMHFEIDGDMVGGYEDRQRLELKTMNGSEDSPHMYSTGGGDSFTHRWKFRLPEDFRVSSEYTHIHQLKPEGGDSGNPTFTLTARKLRTGREVMQLIYRGPIRDNEDPSVNWYPCQVDLGPLKGEWCRVEETVTYDDPGAFRIKVVRIRDMKILLEYMYSPEHYREIDPFVMYRKGNTYIRPKFGIYRRFLHMTPFGLPDRDNPVTEYYAENNELVVLYADIEMDKYRR